MGRSRQPTATISAVGLALVICFLPDVHPLSGGILGQTARWTVQRDLPKQLVAPSVSLSLPRPEIIQPPKDVTNAVYEADSRPVETAINFRPTHMIIQADSAPASSDDRDEEEKYCKKNEVNPVAVGNLSVVEGDIVVGFTEPGHFAPVIIRQSSKWKNGIIPYIMDDPVPPDEQVTPEQRGWIREAMKRWSAETGVVQFRSKAPSDSNYIRFVRTPADGDQYCFSPVGMIGKAQDIQLGPNCDQKNILHEIGHAIGLFHEHTRNDRNKHVKINWGVIKNDYEFAFCRVKYNPYLHSRFIPPGENFGNKYDFRSVMHYRLNAFTDPQKCRAASAGKCRTIEPLPGALKADGIDDDESDDIGTWPELSRQDIESVRSIYGRKPTPPRPSPRHPRNHCWCCRPYHPIDCCPQAWEFVPGPRVQYWRPPRSRFGTYFDDWDE